MGGVSDDCLGTFLASSDSRATKYHRNYAPLVLVSVNKQGRAGSAAKDKRENKELQ